MDVPEKQTPGLNVPVLAERASERERKQRTKEEKMRAREWKETAGGGAAAPSQLGPNAPGKHQEPATPKRRAAHGAAAAAAALGWRHNFPDRT